jgi:hypothetical protein
MTTPRRSWTLLIAALCFSLVVHPTQGRGRVRALKLPEVELDEDALGTMEDDNMMEQQQRAQQRILDDVYVQNDMTSGDEDMVNTRIELERKHDALYRCAQLDPQKRKVVAKAAALSFTKSRVSELSQLQSMYRGSYTRSLFNDFDAYFRKAGFDDELKMICYT